MFKRRLAELKTGLRFAIHNNGAFPYTKTGTDFAGTYVKAKVKGGGEIKFDPNMQVWAKAE